MQIEDTDPPLRELATRIRDIAEWLTGQEVEFHAGSGWYKAGKPIFIWFRVIGPKGTKFQNSVLVTATMQEEKLAESADQVGNNMFGKESYERAVRVGHPEDLAACLEFVGRAYLARYKT